MTIQTISRIQRQALLAIPGTLRTSPTDSLEVHVNLRPAEILIQGELLGPVQRRESGHVLGAVP